jgi:chromosome partitioning protein
LNVVAVLNYKGGVGKTTVAANLGAELARRGRRILLVDMDPQASLTLSFLSSEDMARDFADDGTILHWFRSYVEARSGRALADFVTSPPRVNALVRAGGGRLDLVPSHLGLIDVDLDLAAHVGGSGFHLGTPGYLWVHRLLADALAEDPFRGYDVVLLDCAPNFNMVTRIAVAASDHILIPAKADYLSTLGIDYLRRKVAELVRDYNAAAGGEDIRPVILGVVFTMIQFSGDLPIIAARNYVTRTGEHDLPVFDQMIRESKTMFATAGERGVPAVLWAHGNPNVLSELRQFASEFLVRFSAAAVPRETR